MRGNSGVIGPKLTPSLSSASGMFDTFDVFNARLSNKWPITITYDSLSTNSGTINENTGLSITLNTTGIQTATTLYWTILHGSSSASDFSGTSGSFTQNTSNTGTFTIVTSFTGNTGKTSKTFQIQIRTGSTAGPVVYTSGTFTIPAITVSSLYWSPNPVNEGSSANLYLQMGNCGNYTSYSLTMSNSGTVSTADVSGGFFATSWTVFPGNLSNYTYTFLADLTTEGSETLTVQLSYGGFNIGSAQTLTVSDTSQTVTASVSPSATTINEGDTVTFTVSTTGYPSGTLYWTINQVSGVINDADFTTASAVSAGGSFTISSSAGSFNLIVAPQTLTEGTESFTVSIRYGSTAGTILTTSSTITINDTYTGGVANPTSTTFPVAGRAAFSWNRSSSNTIYEIPTGWTYTFPSNTPTGYYYLVVWNDYASSNTSPTASTSYRTRRVFSLNVVSTYNFANRTATAANLAAITGSGSFERIQGVIITNTTRSQEMVNVTPGSTVDVQYHANAQTVMVVPGDTITISVLLQGPYGEYANWTHNAV